MTFSVTDDKNIALSNALVKIGEQSGTTNQYGECTIIDVPIGVNNIKMVKKGYKTIFMSKEVLTSKIIDIETEEFDTHDVTFKITGDDGDD